jgi:predicted DNA-binding transcriptional regulator AlpA
MSKPHNEILNNIPVDGFLRLYQIVGRKEKVREGRPTIPAIPPIIPVSKSSWWAGVKSGKYPKPVKLSTNTTAWNAEDIRMLIKEFSASPGCPNKNPGQ